MKEKLLFLSAFLPAPSAKQAGQKTAFRHLRWLAERYDVWFVGFRSEADRPEDEENLRALCQHVTVLPVTRWRRIAGLLMRPNLPLVVAFRWSPTFANLVRQLVSRHNFSRAHAEWSQMAEYLDLLPSPVERWISAHDVLSQFFERRLARSARCIRPFWVWQRERSAKWEATAYAKASTILVLSSKDADLLATELSGCSTKIRVVPPQFERFRPRLRKAIGAGPTILFWGAMGRSENSEAATWLATCLVPALARCGLSQARLILAGSDPSPLVKSFASSQVEVTGFVANPQSVFDRAHIAVLPLFRGAGIKVKVLECLVAGLPVLTNSIGAEGIPATLYDGLEVQETDAEVYASTIVKWWREPQRLETLSGQALAWGELLCGGDRSALLA